MTTKKITLDDVAFVVGAFAIHAVAFFAGWQLANLIKSIW